MCCHSCCASPCATFRRRLTVHQQVPADLGLLRIQLDDGATAHAEKLVHGNDGPAQNDRNLDLDALDIGRHLKGYPADDQPRSSRVMVSDFLMTDALTLSPTLARPEWRVRPGLLPYPEAVSFMEQRAEAIASCVNR